RLPLRLRLARRDVAGRRRAAPPRRALRRRRSRGMTLGLVAGAVLAVLAVLYVARPFLREPAPASDVLDEPGELERRRLEPVADAGSTIRAELPPDETGGPVPVHVQRVEPRWFGIAPPHLLLAVAAAACAFAVVLFATGHWPYGLIVLGIGALLTAAFLEAARRRLSSTLTRASTDARERAHSAFESYRARSAAA